MNGNGQRMPESGSHPLSAALEILPRTLYHPGIIPVSCALGGFRHDRGNGAVAPELEFGLLGPVAVRSAGVDVAIPRARERAVLAALLLNANRVVTVDALAEALWGDAIPPTARATVRNYVKRLRDTLGAAGRARIATQPPGYCLLVRDGELDVQVFEERLEAARAAVRDGLWASAADQAQAALRLWRGEALAGAGSDQLTQREIPRLAEMRLHALDLRLGAAIELGRQAEVIGELRRHVSTHPLHERFHALLMAALYRDGRQADALAAYQEAYRVLMDALGAGPGAELRELHRCILAGESVDGLAVAGGASRVPHSGGGAPGGPAVSALGTRGLTAAGGAAARAHDASPAAEAVVAAEIAGAVSGLGPGPPSAGPVPRQLPAAVACFAGREAELAALSELAGLTGAGPRGRPQALVILAIRGAAGVGKTALAVQWAHQAAGQFPDGQLHVNLRGYDPDQPAAPADALAGALRALGVPGPMIPDELEERSRLYRSQLAGRRVLVLLDNARDSDQVRPLLPGDAGCVAVVTSRDALAGLVITDGARRLDLDVLPLADAVAVLRSLIGPRADDEPAAATALAGLCARLPLALRIAAERAAARQPVPLAELAAEITADRLGSLDAGDARASVRAVFSWSFRQLPDAASTAFMLIGLHPGADLDAYAAAALTGISPGEARRVLSRLHEASLLQASGPGRYSLHDLLRAYARELAAARGSGGLSQTALTGLFSYYRGTAAAAMDTLLPAEARQRPRVPRAAAGPELPGPAEARAWLDRERASLVAVVVHAAGHGWTGHASDLAGTLFRYLMQGSYLPEALTVYRHVLQAARRAGDLLAEARAQSGLGAIEATKGHLPAAAGHYRAALECYRQCGDRNGEARVRYNLGVTEIYQHDCASAARRFRAATAPFGDNGDRPGTARGLAGLTPDGTGPGAPGSQAEEHLRRALALFRDTKDQAGEAAALSGTGELCLLRGQLTEAARCFGQSLAIYRSVGHRTGAASQLHNLGVARLHQGEYQQAIGYLRQALALFRTVSYPYGEIEARQYLAEALDGAGQTAAARTELTVILQLAERAGHAYQVTSAHRALAESYHRAGQHEQARHHTERARTR